MNRRIIVVFSLIALACLVAVTAFWISNTTKPSNITQENGQSSSASMEDLAVEYADKPLTPEQISQELDKMVQNKTLTSEEADWLNARIAEIRNAASNQQTLNQPTTLEDYVQYYGDYDSQILNDIKTAQKLYDQYFRNPGPDAPITQSTLQALNQAKLRESGNILHIDSEINQLIINGTVTSEQGTWLRERIHQLRTP